MNDTKTVSAVLLVSLGVAIFLPFLWRVTPQIHYQINLEIENR